MEPKTSVQAPQNDTHDCWNKVGGLVFEFCCFFLMFFIFFQIKYKIKKNCKWIETEQIWYCRYITFTIMTNTNEPSQQRNEMNQSEDPINLELNEENPEDGFGEPPENPEDELHGD